MRALLPVLAFVLLSAPAAAQEGCDPDGVCPSPIPAFVDEEGFTDPRDVNATVGDWYYVSASNLLDERTHTVTLADFGVSLTLAPGEMKDSAPFQLKQEHVGEHLVRDSPSGDTLVFRVIGGDAADHDAGLTDGSTTRGSTTNRTPGLALPLLLAGLAVMAVALRRRA